MSELDRHPRLHAPYCSIHDYDNPTCDCFEPEPPEPDNPAEEAWHTYADAEAMSRDDGGSRED